MMLNNSLIIKGAIVSVVVGALTYYFFVNRNRKPASLVDVLANSNTKSCKDMVDQLLKLGIITDKRVAETMLKVDRAHYVPPHHPTPYKEMAIPIGFNATISAPHMHALGLDILSSKLVNGASVLDIGSGSGYVSACCANMVSPNGRVFGVEHVSELTAQAKVNINTDNPLLFGTISLFVGDGFKGLPTYAPFDAIYVGAASEAIPEALVEQLKPGGRLVIPVGPPDGFHSLVVADKNLDGTLTIKNLGTVRFVPLTSYEKQVQEGSTGLTKVVQTDDGENLLMRTQYHPAPDSTPAEIKILKERFTTQL